MKDDGRSVFAVVQLCREVDGQNSQKKKKNPLLEVGRTRKNVIEILKKFKLLIHN